MRTKGEYFNNCIAFNEVNFTERNHETFVEQVHKEHHRYIYIYHYYNSYLCI